MTVTVFSYDDSTISSGANPDVTFVCVTLFEAVLFVLKLGHSQRVSFASWKLTTNMSSLQDVSCLNIPSEKEKYSVFACNASQLTEYIK